MTFQIDTARDAPDEVAAAARLQEVLTGYDLRRFSYTKRILIDGRATMSHSHPVLTLGPGHVLNVLPDVALTMVVHEQMHWAEQTLPRAAKAIEEVRGRWPAPPGHRDGGARDTASTWLHFVVCALEIAAMVEIVGADRALAANRAVSYYRWIYDQLLSDTWPWREFLDRWDLELPAEPPADHSWLAAIDASAVRQAVGSLVDPFAAHGLGEELTARIVAACCLKLDDHPDDAERLDLLNEDVYALLRMRADDVGAAVRRLRALRPPLDGAE